MRKIHISTVAKYIFPVCLILLCYFNHLREMLIVIELVELIGIFTLSNWIVSREKVGYIVNSLLMLLFNIQMVVLYFGNTYVSMIMLSNFHSVEDIMGKASTYGVGVVLVLFFFFLPVAKVNIRTKVVPIIFFVSLLALEWVLMFVTSATNSPLYSYYDIVKQYHNMKQMNDSIQNAMINNDVEQIDENLDKFYKEEIVNYRKKEQSLVDAPNIILIFTEGLSQNVIDDERNNMPNVAAYQKKSLMFDNYYNHTAATYRGLEGQLYSGYQLYDFDTNNLISIQSILSDNGYNTFFFNAEPYNSDFKAYLSSFEFDYLLGDETYETNGVVQTISDKDLYSIVYEKVIKERETGKPFFILLEHMLHLILLMKSS